MGFTVWTKAKLSGEALYSPSANDGNTEGD